MPTDRYDRQRRLSHLGATGQKRLAESAVVLIGCGALGSHAADHLVRAGVGRLLLVDRDIVEWTNLQRQTIFVEADAEIGAAKAPTLARRLAEVNGEVDLRAEVLDVTHRNIGDLIEGADLLLDGTDNFGTRLLLNDAAASFDLPWIYAGVLGTEGHLAVFRPGRPCLRCYLGEEPSPGLLETCDQAGVLGPAVGAVASLQAGQALRVLVEPGEPEDLHTTLMLIDAWSLESRTIRLPRDPECPCCRGEHPYLMGERSLGARRLCGREAVHLGSSRSGRFDLSLLADRLAGLGAIEHNEHLLRFSAEGLKMTLFHDGRAIIHGTSEPAQARAFYDRFVGS